VNWLETARGDAAMQEGLPFLLALAALEGQHVLLDGQFNLVRLESGERDRDLEAVLVETFDVVGRIALLAHALGGFGEVEKTVESDGRPEQGRKIYSAHSHILPGAKWLRAAPDTTGARLNCGTLTASRSPHSDAEKIWKRGKSFKTLRGFFCRQNRDG
jgi:hypothetical protein